MTKVRRSILALMEFSAWWVMGGAVALGGYALLHDLTMEPQAYPPEAFAVLLACFVGGCAMLALVRFVKRLGNQ